MISLKTEQNAEVLHDYTSLPLGELVRAHEKIDQLKEASADQASANQDWLRTKLKDQLSRLGRKFYCFGRESLDRKKKQDSRGI